MSFDASWRVILPRSLLVVIHDAELFTVGPDEVVVTFRTDDDATVTTTRR